MWQIKVWMLKNIAIRWRRCSRSIDPFKLIKLLRWSLNAKRPIKEQSWSNTTWSTTTQPKQMCGANTKRIMGTKTKTSCSIWCDGSSSGTSALSRPLTAWPPWKLAPTSNSNLQVWAASKTPASMISKMQLHLKPLPQTFQMRKMTPRCW